MRLTLKARPRTDGPFCRLERKWRQEEGEGEEEERHNASFSGQAKGALYEIPRPSPPGARPHGRAARGPRRGPAGGLTGTRPGVSALYGMHDHAPPSSSSPVWTSPPAATRCSRGGAAGVRSTETTDRPTPASCGTARRTWPRRRPSSRGPLTAKKAQAGSCKYTPRRNVRGTNGRGFERRGGGGTDQQGGGHTT